MGDFTIDISKFVKKARGNVDAVIRKTVLDIGRSLIEKTPVGNPANWRNPGAAPKGYVGGHARANWSHSVGVLNAKTFDDIDGTAGENNISYRRIVESVGHGKSENLRDEAHFISNSLPYIQALEDGHSRQAPYGMVALTEAEFRQYIEKETAALK